jgi:hypothetical protein
VAQSLDRFGLGILGTHDQNIDDAVRALRSKAMNQNVTTAVLIAIVAKKAFH